MRAAHEQPDEAGSADVRSGAVRGGAGPFGEIERGLAAPRDEEGRGAQPFRGLILKGSCSTDLAPRD